jgi:hypothetical protein
LWPWHVHVRHGRTSQPGARVGGNFTVSFTDLEVPVAGMPIRVTRTYDSRDKQPGDFGYG